jgi:hypothetical protein
MTAGTASPGLFFFFALRETIRNGMQVFLPGPGGF